MPPLKIVELVTVNSLLNLLEFVNFAFTETTSGSDDVASLAANTNAQTLRDNFEADIVILFTSGNYGSLFGVVNAIGPNDDNAYAIVQTGAATTGRFTFAHEVAHLCGSFIWRGT